MISRRTGKPHCLIQQARVIFFAVREAAERHAWPEQFMAASQKHEDRNMIAIPPLSRLHHWSHQELVALLWTVLNDTHFESLADQVVAAIDRLLLSDQVPPDQELAQQITEHVRALEEASGTAGRIGTRI